MGQAKEEVKMRSSELRQYGLTSWTLFNRAGEKALLALVPEHPGVYVLRCCRDYQLVKGSSDILYVGSATNAQGLKMRLRQYFHPGPSQRTNKRILAVVGECSDFEVAFVRTRSIPDAKMLEATILEVYERDHGELPPQNLRH